MNTRIPVFVVFASLACVLYAQEGQALKLKSRPAPVAKKKASAKPGKVINLNSAPKNELMRLPGVDEAMAEKIIAGRPYRSKFELVTRGIMPRGLLQTIKNNVSAHQVGTTK